MKALRSIRAGRKARPTRTVAAVLVALAGVACDQGPDPRVGALEAEVKRLRSELGECQTQRVACEEDDRFLYSDGIRALEAGDVAVACATFETLLSRYPSSPLAPIAGDRLEACQAASADEEQGADRSATDDTPIAIQRAWLREDQFGVPLANVRVENVSRKTIRSYKVAIQCYDESGGVLRHLTKGNEWFVAAGVGTDIPPGHFAKGGPWAMTGFLTCYRFDVVPLRVEFTDGGLWER